VKHVVHCSGYSLAEKCEGATNKLGEVIDGKFHDWDRVCIGVPQSGLLGRIPMALRIAALLPAECIIWSTGATYFDQLAEAEIMLQVARERFGDILSRETVFRISIIEKESADTFSSMQCAATIIKKKFEVKPIMLHLVTSANHAPRVARDALIVFGQNPDIILSVVPAHTSYGNKQPVDVRIQELGQP
jgi:hypothetical protein